MTETLVAKLRGSRPMSLGEAEAALVREALREAMSVTLGIPKERIGDDARIFDELGLDSIDVFDVLDQIGERFEIQVALEELPNELLRGGGAATFRDFTDGILNYLRSAPKVQPETGPPDKNG